MIFTTPAQFEQNLLQRDSLLARHIPYSHLINEETVETKSGHLLQVIQLEGLFAETLEDHCIDQEKQTLANLLNSLSDSTTSLYFHTIRKKISPHMAASYDLPFAQRLHERWHAILSDKNFYTNSHTITVVKKPPVGKVRGLVHFIKRLKNCVVQAEREQYRLKQLNDLNQITQKIMTQLSHYRPSKLSMTTCQRTNIRYSTLLSFLSYLINLEESKVIPPRQSLADYLSFKRIFFDKTSGTIALRDNHQVSRYAAILALKDYPGVSFAGLMDTLLDLPVNIIINQTFSFLDKGFARSTIRELQRNQLQSDDGDTSDQLKIHHALDDLGTGTAAVGEHTLSILCHAENPDALEDAITQINTALTEMGAIAIREDEGLKLAYFASIPGNHAYLARKAMLTTKHMAGFASFHNFASGKREGNHWGDAITVLETISGAPYYFNFHVLDVGNTFLIGPMGSGKTLTEAFLLTLSMKYGGRLVVFDKDRGLETLVRVLNGYYTELRAGQPTGMAPFQMADTPENRYALGRLLRMIAQTHLQPLTDHDEHLIHTAILGAYQLPREERIFRNIVPFLGVCKRGSLRMRFESWVNQGDYAWAFDNDVDQLDLSPAVIGYDLTSILADPHVRNPLYYYLFYRNDQRLDGTPTRIVGAEIWKALDDPEFQKMIKEWSSTPRKKNALLVLDTQAPEDIAQSPIGCKIIQETVTQIYFANPAARYDDYVLKFGLTPKEFEIIKSLAKSSHYFLLKQGGQSVVARIDLSKMPDEKIILSNRTQYTKILDPLLQQVGSDPAQWLQPYLDQVKALGG